MPNKSFQPTPPRAFFPSFVVVWALIAFKQFSVGVVRLNSIVGQRMNKTSEIIKIARDLANDTLEFHNIKGPGIGDHATREFMRNIRQTAHEVFGVDYSEKKISHNTNFAVDFWFPDEMTVVEFALTLRNSSSEFHKDIFKVLLAIDCGEKIQRLVFISKPGAIKRHNEPASKAIKSWLKTKYNVEMTIIELT